MTTKRVSETHLERKQVGIVRCWCERADTLCKLVEVVLCIVITRDKEEKASEMYLVLTRRANREPYMRCEVVEGFRTDYWMVAMKTALEEGSLNVLKEGLSGRPT